MNNHFFFEKLGRGGRENDSAIALKEQDIFPLKRYFEFTRQRRHGQLGVRPDQSQTRLLLPLI